MSKRLTTEEYKNRVYDVWGNEYSVIENYVDAKTKLHFIHNKCGWIIDSYPNAFLIKNSKCPICDSNSKNMSTSALKRKILNKSGADYELIGEYKTMTSPIQIKHNNCCCNLGYNIFTTTPKNFLEHTGICPKERHKGTKLDITTIQERLTSFHNGYMLLSTEYNDPDQDLLVKCDRGHKYDVKIDGISMGTGCPICDNKIILVGYNDYCTTHPQQAKYLLNYSDGHKFCYGTNKDVKFKCINCGRVIEKRPNDAFNKQGQFICSCNDGISFPEKFMFAFLTQLKIDFIYQLTCKHKTWCQQYRYDFYIPENNTIIEVHGMQHYADSEWSSLKQVQKNDFNKEILAKNNNCNYIVIDAKFSDFEYIKNNIINSEINNLYDLAMIDWVSCNIAAKTSLYINVVEMWNNHLSVKQICNETKLSITTILKYLEDAGNIGLCNFDREIYRKQVNHGNKRISVICVEENITYSSFAEVRKKLGINLTKKKIIKNNYIGGFHWEFA